MERSFKSDVEQIQKLAADLLECNEMNAGNFERLQVRVRELEAQFSDVSGQLLRIQSNNSEEGWQKALVENDRLRGVITTLESELAALRKPGPATDGELRSHYEENEQDTPEAMDKDPRGWCEKRAAGNALRAVYNLGVTHGRARLAISEEKVSEYKARAEKAEETVSRYSSEIEGQRQRAERAEAMFQNAVNDQMRMAEASRASAPVTEPPADLVEAVAKALNDAHIAGQHPYVGLARAALAVVQPEIDRLTTGLVESEVTVTRRDARIAELTKEREAAYHTIECANRHIAELTRPREVDDALVAKLAEVIKVAWAQPNQADYFISIARSVLAAVPPNLSQPVELTDAELITAYTSSSPGTTWMNPKGLRAVIAAAGRYTKRVEFAAPPRTVSREELERACKVYWGLDVEDKTAMAMALQAIGLEVEGSLDAGERNSQEAYERASAACNDEPAASDRLPYVGLTKEEATDVQDFLHDELGVSHYDMTEALRIIAKALGAGGGK